MSLSVAGHTFTATSVPGHIPVLGAVYRAGLDLLSTESDPSQVGERARALEPVRLQRVKEPRRPLSQSSDTCSVEGQGRPAGWALQDESELARRERQTLSHREDSRKSNQTKPKPFSDSHLHPVSVS